MKPRRETDGLTFCIPNWNHRNFLARSIGTAYAAARELQRIGVGSQILVVDDASRDGSQRMLLAMAMADPDGILDVVIAPRNRGLAASRNAGLRHARYRHICFMDADNQLIAENIGLFWRAVQQTGAAVVYGNLLQHDGREIEGLLSNDFIDDQYLDANYVDAFAIYDAEKLDLCGGYDERMTSHEDWEMLLHILAEDEDLVFVPVCMGYYYVVPHSMLKTEVFDHSKIFRMFNQRKSGFSGLRSRRKMFHPDLGWLINDDEAGATR
jgi:glycosyltransferase involved in cell wall biosynthesis